VKLTVVGCAGSFPNNASPASCYLIEHDGAHVVLDLGNGSLGALQSHLDPTASAAISALVLSHCHVDHCADVASLYVLRRYGPTRPEAPMLLLGPHDARDRIASIYGMDDPRDLDREFDIRVLGPGAVEVGPFVIEAARVAHPVESYAVRVTAGRRSITYSGDTGPTAALVELARGTDLALFEASCVGDANPPDLHMTGADAGRAASEAGAAMLVLTHHVSWNDEAVVLAEAVGEFTGPIEQAAPGMTISL
jgi:ribonuclease BN (tRNA processing enzyme)